MIFVETAFTSVYMYVRYVLLRLQCDFYFEMNMARDRRKFNLEINILWDSDLVVFFVRSSKLYGKRIHSSLICYFFL